MKYDEFLKSDRVADELNIPEDEARDRVSAVLQTLGEAVTPGELEDVLAQLDREYAELSAR